MFKERIAKGILGLVLAGLAAGYGVTELDRLAENRHIQKAIEQTVELAKEPQSAFKTSSSSQHQKIEPGLILNPIEYELPKAIAQKEICQYYTDLNFCARKEVKDETKD